MKTTKRNIRISSPEGINVTIGCQKSYAQITCNKGEEKILVSENGSEVSFNVRGVANVELPSKSKITRLFLHGTGNCPIKIQGASDCSQTVKELCILAFHGEVEISGDAFFKELKEIHSDGTFTNNLSDGNICKVISI